MQVVNLLSGLIYYTLFTEIFIVVTGQLLSNSNTRNGGLLDFQRKLVTIVLNGSSFELDTSVCTGGVMLKGKTTVSEFCAEGVFAVREHGCLDKSVFVGFPNEYTCNSFPDGVQAFFVVRVEGEDGSTTVTSLESNTVGEVISTNTEESTSTVHYLDNSSAPGLLEFSHNSLLEKRGVKTSDLNENTTNQSSAGVTNNGAGEEKLEKSSSEEDTMDLEESDVINGTSGSASGGGLNGRLDDNVKPYDVQGINFQVVTETSADGDGDQSGEDTKPILEGEPVLVGRGLDLLVEDLQGRGAGVDFKKDEATPLEFSSEIDERGGEWEKTGGMSGSGVGGSFLLDDDTEVDAAVGNGFDKWVEVIDRTPLFDAHVALMKKQVDFELIHWGSHVDENIEGGTPSSSHVSVVGRKDLAFNSTWFRILSEIISTTSTLIPEELFSDPFLVPGGAGGGGEKGGGLPIAKIKLFDDVLRIFGYFMRSWSTNEDDLNDRVVEAIVKGFRECRKEADAFRGNVTVGGVDSGECFSGVEIKSIRIVEPVWSEFEAAYKYFDRDIRFSADEDFPPMEFRINPRRWVFAELMWYSAQVTYMFCFNVFSNIDINAFMSAYDIVLKLFRSDLVKELWEGVGGNLGVFEIILPYVKRGGKGTGGFRELLAELDKIYGSVRKMSVVTGFGRTRSRGEEGNKEPVSWDAGRRRRKRDVGGDGNGGKIEDPSLGVNVGRNSMWENVGDLKVEKVVDGSHVATGSGAEFVTTTQVPGSQIPTVPGSVIDTVSEFPSVPVMSDTAIPSQTTDVPVVQEAKKPSKVFSQTGWFTSTTVDPISSSSTVTSPPAIKGGKEEIIGSTVMATDVPIAAASSNLSPVTLGVEVNPVKEIIVDGGQVGPAEERLVTTASTNGSSGVVMQGSNSNPVETTTTSTEDVVGNKFLKGFEIWGGMGYCVVLDGGGNLKPAVNEFINGGVCQ